MSNWVDRIKKHALVCYNEDGWDILVECWTDDYISEHCRDCSTYEEALSSISSVLSVMSEYRYDIQNS